MIRLGEVSLNEIDYASQGNAILGIRGSGKTYTATYLAERLLEAGVPFIAFDPIGVWRFLQVGREGHAGYPVVVAGENGDLDLTAENAASIVRAAMQENVSLVLDLYSIQFSKTQIRRIVEESVNVLLFENKDHGLRHVFIEEAAEFVPQRVMSSNAHVYGVMEKLARLGRNAQLGYTLINQRAEEVNKAVLELCDCLFLHRQKGRNSLVNVKKWLDVADAENRREITRGMSTLPTGQCWLWSEGQTSPLLVTIPEKKTMHPNPKAETLSVYAKPADVSAFLARMKSSLAIQEIKSIEAKAGRVPKTKKEDVSVPETSERVVELERMLEQSRSEARESRRREMTLSSQVNALREHLKPQYDALSRLFAETPALSSTQDDHWDIWKAKLMGKQRLMLEILIERKRITRNQLRLLVGLKPKVFTNYLGALSSLKLIRYNGEYLELEEG